MSAGILVKVHLCPSLHTKMYVFFKQCTTTIPILPYFCALALLLTSASTSGGSLESKVYDNKLKNKQDDCAVGIISVPLA